MILICNGDSEADRSGDQRRGSPLMMGDRTAHPIDRNDRKNEKNGKDAIQRNVQEAIGVEPGQIGDHG